MVARRGGYQGTGRMGDAPENVMGYSRPRYLLVGLTVDESAKERIHYDGHHSYTC